MDCNMFTKLLKDYITGELPDEKSKMMDTHMNQCNNCKKLYDENYLSYKALQNISSDSVNFESSRAEILSKIDKTKYGKSISKRLSIFKIPKY